MAESGYEAARGKGKGVWGRGGCSSRLDKDEHELQAKTRSVGQ